MWILNILIWIRNLLNPKSKLTIPHPEEAMNPLATFQNTDIGQIRDQWLVKWQVPEAFWSGWRTISIILVEDLTVVINGAYVKVPAATVAEERRISIDPHWANAGILAHENSHISYSFLSMEQKAKFVNAYKEALATDALLKLLYAEKTYMQSNSVEAFADIYRFLGQKMPRSLITFYPKLL